MESAPEPYGWALVCSGPNAKRPAAEAPGAIREVAYL